MSLEGAIAVHRFGLGARPGRDRGGERRSQGLARGPDRDGGGAAGRRTAAPFPTAAPWCARNRHMIRAARRHQEWRRSAASDQSPDAVKKFVAPGSRSSSDEMAAPLPAGLHHRTALCRASGLVLEQSFHGLDHGGAHAEFRRRLRARGDPPLYRRQIREHAAGGGEPSRHAGLSQQRRHPSGRDSLAGERSGRGRNENLGRELMELYSLGVDGGYTQADVIALANILTGWGLDPDAPSRFRLFSQPA